MEATLDQQTYSRTKLAMILAERKSKNPLYSLRAFAKSLKVPASTLSDFLNDKKDLTGSTNNTVMKMLLSPEELNCFNCLQKQAELKVVEVQSLRELERSAADNSHKMFFNKSDSTYYVYVDAATKKQITKIYDDLIKRTLRLSKKIKKNDFRSRVSIHFSTDGQ